MISLTYYGLQCSESEKPSKPRSAKRLLRRSAENSQDQVRTVHLSRETVPYPQLSSMKVGGDGIEMAPARDKLGRMPKLHTF